MQNNKLLPFLVMFFKSRFWTLGEAVFKVYIGSITYRPI